MTHGAADDASTSTKDQTIERGDAAERINCRP